MEVYKPRECVKVSKLIESVNGFVWPKTSTRWGAIGLTVRSEWRGASSSDTIQSGGV